MAHRVRLVGWSSVLAVVVATTLLTGPARIQGTPVRCCGPGTSLTAVSFPDPTHGWAVGVAGGSQSPLILATSDGGTHWNAQTAPAAVTILLGVSFVDDLHGWAAGFAFGLLVETAAIIATTDGGATWTQQTLPALGGGGLNAIKFVTASNGWAVGGASTGGFIIHTSNGGATWTPQTVPASLVSLSTVSFVDSANGWAAGFDSGTGLNPGVVLATSDGGVNWAEHLLPTGFQPNSIVFNDIHNGWVVGTTFALGDIAVTHDGGATWARQPVPSGTVFLSGVAFASAAVGWAVGGNDLNTAAILGTTDGGSSWHQQQPPPTSAVLAAVAAVNSSTAWAVGSGVCQRPSIAATTDGVTWMDQNTGPPWVSFLEDVASAGSTNAWVVGSDSCGHGVVLGTSNAGGSWTAEVVPPGVSTVFAVTFPDANHGWALAGATASFFFGPSASIILATSDGGRTWVRQTLPNGVGFLSGINFVNAADGWAVGTGSGFTGGGQELRTTNGGATWTLQTLSSVNSLNGVWFADPAKGWATGQATTTFDGVVLATTDGGMSWTTQSLPPSSFVNVVRFPDSVNGWTVGDTSSSLTVSGLIAHTTNGGGNWGSQTVPPGVTSLNGAAFVSTSAGWTTGFSQQPSGSSTGLILGTSNAGATWTQEAVPAGVAFVGGVAFASTTNGWAAGTTGAVGAGPKILGALQPKAAPRRPGQPLSTPGAGPFGQPAGVILATANGGTTWTEQPYVYPPATLQLAPVAVLPALANAAYGGYTTVAYIKNTGSALAHIAIRYYDAGGNPTGVGDQATVAPNATWTVRQDNGHSFTATGAGSGVIWSDQTVVSFANEFAPNNIGDATSYTAVAIGNWTGGTLYAPAIANGAYGGYTTGIALVNTGPVSTNVTVTYRAASGSTVKTQTQNNVPSNAYVALYSGDPLLGLPAGFAGTATITSSTGTVAAIVNEVGPGGQFSSYDAMPTPSMTLYAPAALNNAYGGYYTGMGIQNASGTAGAVTVDYYNSVGTPTTKHFNIAANGYVPVYQGSATDGPAPGAYTARITGTVPLVAIVNEIAPAAGSAQQSTSYPAFVSGAPTLNLPLVTNASSDGWSTGEGIMNIGSSQAVVTVTYFDAATGSPIGSPQTQTLQPNAFWGLYQPVGGLPAGARASAIVSVSGGVAIPGEGIAVICNESSLTSFMSYVGG